MTIAEIKQANKASGGYFFSRETMRFFGSKVVSGVYHGATKHYFITSERTINRGELTNEVRYTVREFDVATGNVRTAPSYEKYRKFERLETARGYAKSYAETNKFLAA